MKRAVFTSITDGYDDLKEPLVINKEVDYICYCDTVPTHEKNTVWKFKHIYDSAGRLSQRILKAFPQEIFNKYDQSIWVDGSIQIKSDLKELFGFLENEEMIVLQHPTRKCIYVEAEACIHLKKDKEETILKQIDRYKREGMPYNVGMVATGVILRNHTKDVIDFGYEWAKEIKNNSCRDQLSFNYINWKQPIDYSLLPFNILSSKHLQLCRHKVRKSFA